MVSQYSILHISDLHKPDGCDLANLFYSLQIDCEGYVNAGIQKPEIIVVSGDLVEGTKDTGSDAENIIRAQYAEVGKFLAKLTNYFLDGDRRRMVIVPGNHDYCYKTSKDSMMPCPKENAEKDYEKWRQPDSGMRWNWKDFRFYHIENQNLYVTRFDLFREFYNDFFAGIREMPEQIDSDSYVINLPAYRLAFVCFNSCYRLDHLNPMGCICASAISSSHEKVVNLKNQGSLLIGVWHHHVSGLPAENNYMDHRILGAMMDEDVKVGLFGHQHVSAVVHEYNDITQEKTLLLISSGSLYGTRSQLAAGIPRQYNIIEMTYEDKKVSLRLNIRKDISQYGYDIPHWSESAIGRRNLPRYERVLQLEEFRLENVLADIDSMARTSKDYAEACRMLHDLGMEDELVQRYFDSYLPHVTDIELLKMLLQCPMTTIQYMKALDVAIESKDKDWIFSLLGNECFKDERNPYIGELKEKALKMF